MIQLSYSQALALLREAVAEKGEDFVYTDATGNTGIYAACQYVHHTSSGPVPGCLVGNALHRAGVPLDTLAEYEFMNASEVLETMSKDAVLRTGDTVVRLLETAQSWQDRGTPWGQAVTLAVADQSAPDL